MVNEGQSDAVVVERAVLVQDWCAECEVCYASCGDDWYVLFLFSFFFFFFLSIISQSEKKEKSGVWYIENCG